MRFAAQSWSDPTACAALVRWLRQVGFRPKTPQAQRGAKIARVMRDTQVNSPASLTMSICQTCVVRPMCTRRAVPVTQPLVAARMGVGVDVQAYAAVAFGAGVERADGAPRFGQHHVDIAVQQAIGLEGGAVLKRTAPHGAGAYHGTRWAGHHRPFTFLFL